MSLSAELVEGIKNKERYALARAITLVESKKDEHRAQARELLKLIYPLTGKARRIAVSGTPGVGKSTFLENYGMHLIQKNKNVAVLAIDPTSQITGGSILGDKTRMTHLSAHENAFIRPSPNGETLGGIAAKTREAMLLCDAFGFDYIFIETVGVGQSELSVSHLVDFFILLMQPGSGDELQGIKRGILEVSDLVLIHKADGANKKLAQVAQHDFKKSLSILQHEKKWMTPVIQCSSLEKSGFDDIDQSFEDFYQQFDLSVRSKQLKIWLKEMVLEKVSLKVNKLDFEKSLENVEKGKTDILTEIDQLINEVLK